MCFKTKTTSLYLIQLTIYNKMNFACSSSLWFVGLIPWHITEYTGTTNYIYKALNALNIDNETTHNRKNRKTTLNFEDTRASLATDNIEWTLVCFRIYRSFREHCNFFLFRRIPFCAAMQEKKGKCECRSVYVFLLNV